MSGFGGFGSFGQNNNQQSAPTGFGAFGTNTGTGFGASTTTGFGSNNASSAGAFGNPSVFGSATNNAFGAAKPTGFGMTSQTGSGLFGNTNTSTTSAFGSTGFGSTTTPSSGFGAGTTGGNGLFGASTTNSPFGGTATTSSAFGAPAQSLISQAGAGECQGTGSVPFQAFVEKEPNSNTNQQNSFQNIAFQAPYQKFSMEELRLADYNQGRRFGNGSNQPGAFGQSNFGGFGSNNSGFGTTTNTTGANIFGAATTSSPFGTTQQPSTGFGTSAATTGNGLFGSKPTTGGVFGSQPTSQPTSGLFGSSNTGFGQQNTNAFGTNPSSGSVFGQNSVAKSPFSFGAPSNNTNPSPFGTSASTGFGNNGGLFGSNSQQQPASTGFGTQPAPTNGFGAFGSNNQSSGTTSLFGSNQSKPTGGLFGTPAATNSTNLFGQPQAAQSTSVFGAPNTTQNNNDLLGNKPSGSGTDVFGSSNNTQPNNGTNLFGGFGTSNQTQTSGLFGNLSNNNNNNNQPKPSVFGNTQSTGGNGLFGNPGTQNQSSLFGGFGSSQQPQQQPNQNSLFGSSIDSFSAQTQNNQVPQSLTASIGDNSAFGSQSLFSNITATQVSNPGPIATPLSSCRNSAGPKNAAIPLYKLNSGSASRFSTPQRRGFGFSYSTYGSPSSATSTSSTPGTFSNNNLLGAGSFSRTLSKSMSTSSLRRSFNAEDSILAPGAFSASSGSRHFGGTGNIKKLTINRNIRSDLFGPMTPQPQPTAMAPSSGILKKHVSFDSNINGNGAGATSPLKQVNNTTSNSAELGFKLPHSNSKSNKSPSSEIEPVPNSNNQLAIVREEESLDAADSSALVPVEGKNSGDYWMSPSKVELESMNRIQRQTVSGFTVGRYGIGSVQFDVPVDLTSVNLNDIMGNIVRIEVRQVTVYPENYKKPPMGKGLNVPSTITLENSWPRKKDRKTPLTDQSGIRLQKHIDKLKRVEGTEFVNYEKTTGTWTFRVPHFTTYGLPEEDEDEDDDVMESELSSHEQQTPNLDSYIQSFASTSQLTQTESGPEDTFEFRKSKRLLPGTFDDQELYYNLQDNFKYLEHVSSVENQSLGSQSECGTEEPTEKYDFLNDNESVSIMDQDMVGTYPETLNDIQLLDPLNNEGEDPDMSRLDASLSYSTPSKGHFGSCDDWVSTLRATVSPRKKDRSLLKRLLQSQDNETPLDIEETPTQNQAKADEQGFSTSIDLMASLFGEKKIPNENLNAIKKDKISEYQNSSRSKISDHNDVQADETKKSLPGPMKPRWGFDGTLIYAAPIPGRGSRIKDDLLTGLKSEIVSEHRDVRFAKFSNEASAEFLNKHKAIAIIDYSSGFPRAALPRNLLFTDFVDDHAPHHEKLVWQLASILWDPLQVPEELIEIPHIISRIRKDNLSKFWKKIVDDSSSRQIALARCNEEKVIACLSGHKIDDACSYLVNAGDLRLSTLIALIGSKDSIKDDIRFQIQAWQKSNMLSEMTQPIRALYEILAGNVCVCSEVKGAPEDRVESFSISKRFGLSWRQAFGLRLWYGISSLDLIEAAVERFTHDISEEKEESRPTPWYIEQKVPLLWEDPCVNQREDLLWGMLKLYTFGNSDLEDVLRPENSQLSPMDIRLSWQLSQAITSSGLVNFTGDNEEKSDRTTLSFAAQLVNEGHWLDAIFVLLHLTSPNARFMAIQDHLGRYAGYIGGEDCPIFIKLTKTFKLPTAWIWEAKALYLRSVNKDPRGEVECLIKSGSFNEAHETFSREVAPKLIIELDYSSLRNLLVGFAGKDLKIKDWSLGVGLYSDYLDFIENMNKGLPADELVLEKLLSRLPSLADESRHPNFMERVAIETMSSTAANALLGVVKNSDKISLAKLLNLPLTEDKYLRHSVELSLKYYSSLMNSFK